MSFEITIEQNIAEQVKELAKYPELLSKAIFKGFEQEAPDSVQNITWRRLRGQGPFPVSAHRLGHVSGELVKAFSKEGPHRNGNEVQVAIGSNKFYAFLHEFGWSGRITRKAHTVRSHKRAIKNPNSKKLFAKVKSHKRKQSKSYDHDIPARAPIAYGIRDRLPKYEKAITTAIIDAWKELK